MGGRNRAKQPAGIVRNTHLGQALLQFAPTMGKKYPRSIRIELKITHEQLSEMAGTTRPRISLFMQRFHNLGLIETNKDRFFISKEKKLTDYLAHITWRQCGRNG